MISRTINHTRLSPLETDYLQREWLHQYWWCHWAQYSTINILDITKMAFGNPYHKSNVNLCFRVVIFLLLFIKPIKWIKVNRVHCTQSSAILLETPIINIVITCSIVQSGWYPTLHIGSFASCRNNSNLCLKRTLSEISFQILVWVSQIFQKCNWLRPSSCWKICEYQSHP